MMDFTWKTVYSFDLDEVSEDSFLSGIKVYIERPHILNRKISTVEVLNFWALQRQNYTTTEDLDEVLKAGNFTYDSIIRFLEPYCLDEKDITCGLQEINKKNTIIISIRKLIPRNFEKFKDVLEVVVIDTTIGCVTFYPKKEDVLSSRVAVSFAYRIRLNNNSIILEAYCCKKMHSIDGRSEEWLKTSVLPKIANWSQSSPTATGMVSSLNLICSKSYAQNYFHLKSKYAKKLIEIWPECTDPLKYVYEDIAIATYLMTYWEAERNKLNLEEKQSFIDLGCGNGLLVYLLSAEGYPGVGYDVRKRKIWDLFGPETNLIEKSIEPSAKMKFLQYDWIIGNHSDELTPWIPTIAARSTYNTKMFLLPCCFYTFNGKYERKHAGIPQYQSYLNFIKELCSTMGFSVLQDKLRIPSTKRICFVGASRNYKEEEENMIEEARIEFINLNSKKIADKNISSNLDEKHDKIKETLTDSSVVTDSGLLEFIPRNPIESVQNCSQLDEAFRHKTVIDVMNILLKTESYLRIERPDCTYYWNAGGIITIEDLVKKFDHNTLKKMKNQHGGFQTFLRNYKSVFLVEKGKVQLRFHTITQDWKVFLKRDTKCYKLDQLRKKKCYFHHHHPQGCILPASACTFLHEI